MKILVVDDEALINQYVARCIRESDIGDLAVETANSGAKALKVLKETAVDVAFVDITMPKMDGLELLRQIKKEYPSITVVMLTCHNEFEYARQAMQNKADNYILKSELTPDVMKKVLEEVREGRKEHRLAQQTSQMKQQDYLKRIMVGNDPLVITEENLRKYNIFLRDDAFLALCVENVGDDLVRLMAETESGYENPVVYPYNENLTILLLNLRRTGRRWNELQDLYAELDADFQRIEAKLTGSLGHSRPFFRMARLSTAIREALEDYNDRFYGGHCSSEMPYEEREKRLQRLMTESAIRIEEKNWTAAIEALHEAIGFSRENHADASVLKRTAGQLCAVLENQISVDLSACAQRLATAESFSALVADIRTILDTLDLQSVHYSSAIRAALAYIDQNYTQDITLNMVADHVFLSREYLSRRFKKEVNLTISEYLMTYRLNRAKELLESGDMRISDVADQVGIPNVSYFSTVFRKEFGCSPSDVRQGRGRKSLKN